MKAEEIQEEIERTRGDMAGTIDAIERKLNPRQLMDQAVDTMRDLTSEDTNVGRMVRDNPVPLALIGLGLGWLAVSAMAKREESDIDETYGSFEGYEGAGLEGAAAGSAWASPGATETTRSSEYGYGGYAGGTSGYGADAGYSSQEARGGAAGGMRERAEQMRERAGQMAGQAREGISRATQESRAKMSKMTRSARYQASHAADRTWETFQDHPLTSGFVAAMLGAAIGAILPRSRTEREVLGPQAREAMGRAREAAGDLAERAGHVASTAVEKVREEAKEAMHEVVQATKEDAKAQGLTGQKGGQGSSLTH